MDIKSLKPVHWVTIILSVGVIAYVTLQVTTVKAEYTKIVGTISVTNFVPNAGSGHESATLSFTGILGQDSTADLTGWKLKNSTGFEYDLSGVELTNTNSVKLCEEGTTNTSCDYNWVGNNVFPDVAGDFIITDSSGSVVVSITYTGSTAGRTWSGSGDYTATVYTPGDKIDICEMQKNGTLKSSSANIQRLTRDVESTVVAGVDIIPPFVYERNKTVSYHPGVNWPDQKQTLLNNCN